MKIGTVNINKKAVLAPMAGVTDRAFRELCMKFGAGYTVSEMVSSKGISYLNKKSIELMEISEKERPCGIQLFGDNPEAMATAAKIALEQNPDIIDINMGCPAPKVNKSGGGAVLMKNPDLCYKIVKAVKDTSTVPVTVKIRKGWDEQSINAVEIAKVCESAGASAITVHGRTREQMYKPFVDLKVIEQVKLAVSIPVIGNGDIFSPKDAINMLSQTGCDLVMIGRGALGNPFIFSEINAVLNNETFAEPKIEEKVAVMTEHILNICKYKGEYLGMKEARRHICMYLKGIPDAASFRNQACHLETMDQFLDFANKITKIV
ncbi:MAG: tRNA-dihydrouridine synthase B [Eubacteriales bacterium SKADARSKE-1]|nr:tRNA-dihydrouridine synthase B [Eubacteriales bacterium SKADARSKE-1]